MCGITCAQYPPRCLDATLRVVALSKCLPWFAIAASDVLNSVHVQGTHTFW